MKRNSIRFQLSVRIAGVFLLAVIFAVLALWYFHSNITIKVAKMSLGEYADYYSHYYEYKTTETKEMRELLDKYNITISRAFAEILHLNPALETDTNGLIELAARLNVEELCVIDENGIIVGSSYEPYLGYDFHVSKQTVPFLAILDDPTLEIAQDPQPNGYSGKLFQYIGVSQKNKKGIAQIGLEPTRYQELLERNAPQALFGGLKIGASGYIFILGSNGRYVAHPNVTLVGSFAPEIRSGEFITIDNQKLLAETRYVGDELLVAVLPYDEIYDFNQFSTILLWIVILVSFVTTYLVIELTATQVMIRGVQSVLDAVNSIADGNFSTIPIIEACDEFIQISNGIRQMSAKLEERIAALQKLGYVDHLTRIPNRRYFDTEIESEWKRSIRNGTKISMCMLDIDLFKNFNDVYGHQHGDKVLAEVAKAIERSVVRPADFVARYGGEEFVVILPDTDLDGAMLIAERMRLAVEALSIWVTDSKNRINTKVTVSIGVATASPLVGDKYNALIERTDIAMYNAKRTGRNKICVSKE